ncbi:MAG: GTPase ObgE [Gemmataceae bacterium]|nr:GTPase ObgE [Gemmataceae bacterium]MCS7270399.1 GTPase ObgE [Gemmataceae bacterium]MDW8242449.1 GTPase ObgE [Thermogemmata sp.]
MFVDRLELYVKGGDGGRGAVSFRREKYVPRGGPDGGDGGNGGSVIVQADANADTLAGLATRKHWRARNGGAGQGNNRHGKNGQDIILLVPPGTLVRDRERGHVLKDLVHPGDSVVVARGGKGGRGNAHFKSPTNRTPRQYEPGEAGEERWIVLELKLIADAGLIGLPNAGKSTLLSRVSRATPAIAPYPFTTRYPNLGVVSVGDSSFVLADLPGLIEGAAQGAGLGHEFLRHVERTRLLIHLVEPFPADGSDPWHNYQIIRRELREYAPALEQKPQIVCVSKGELPGAEAVQQRLEQLLGEEVLLISAVTGLGLAQLMGRAARRIAELKTAASPQSVPVSFAREAAVRTADFRIAAVPGITPDAAELYPEADAVRAVPASPQPEAG